MLTSPPVTPSSQPATPTSRPGTPLVGPSACSKCSVLRARLAASIQRRKQDFEMHRSRVTKLKDKLLVFRKLQTMGVLNQKLKRRDEQLEKLRAEPLPIRSTVVSRLTIWPNCTVYTLRPTTSSVDHNLSVISRTA